MRRVHEAYTSPATIIQTLRTLGILGIVPTGALAWQTYPIAAQGAELHASTSDAVDGTPVGIIPPDLISAPYYVTHFSFLESHRDGGRIGRTKLQDGSGNNLRIFRYQSPAKRTAGVSFGQGIAQEILAFQRPANSGVQAVMAMDNNAFDVIQRCYLTALLVQPQIIPALLTKAPTAQGTVLPTTVAGTVVTAGGTAWTFGSYVQMTAGLGTGALVTAVVLSGSSVNDGQVAFATGGAGSEVDWGIFGWAEAFGVTLSSTRLCLMPFPLYLPSSTRLAARVRANNPGDTWNVGIEYIPIPLR